MAVTRCVKKLGGIEGPNIRPDRSRSYRETWIVQTDSAANDGTVVVAHAGLPRMNQAYPNDSAALVIGIDPRQVGDPGTVWEVVVTYDTNHGNPANTNEGGPLDDPIKLRWDAVEVEHAEFEDLDGKLWKDTAGTPFADPPPIPLTHLVLTVERNESSFSAPVAMVWGNSVNESAWLGAPPDSVLCRTPTASEEYADGQSYWKIIYRFEFNPKLWIPYKVLLVGPYYLEMSGAEWIRKRASDDDGNLGGVAFLGENGTKLAPGFYEYGDFRFYDRRDFNQLNLFA